MSKQGILLVNVKDQYRHLVYPAYALKNKVAKIKAQWEILERYVAADLSRKFP